MMIGPQSARPDSARAGFPQKLLSLLVALALSLSMTPCVAWAAAEDSAPTAAPERLAENSDAENAVAPTESATSDTESEDLAGEAETGDAGDGSNSGAVEDDSEADELPNVNEADAVNPPLSSALEQAAPTMSCTLSSVGVVSSGQLMQVGDTVTPRPMHMAGTGEWAYESDLPDDAVVAYAWYAADDAFGSNLRKVSGAQAGTGALVLTEAMQGAYLHVVANAGDNDVRSEPFLVESAAPKGLTVGAKVVGTTKHKVGEEFSAEAWVPLTEYAWSSDEKTTAWDVFAKLLDKAGYHYSLTGGTPHSITTPDKTYTLAMSASEPWSYWAFFVNGEYANAAANGYVLKDGDSIELRYIDATGQEKPSGDVVVKPDAEHPDLGVEWGGFGNGGAGSVVQNVATPTGQADAAWTSSLLTDAERAAGAYASASEPLIIGGKLYVVSGSTSYDPETRASVSSLARLMVIDPATGAADARQLATTMDSVCRPVYADGIVVIPLSGGYLQAVSAATLETLWVVEGVPGAQSLSTLTVSDGYVYVSTADSLDNSWNATSGTIRRVNLRTGALAGSASNGESGYYWAGGAMANGCFLVPDDSGRITSHSSDLSKTIGSVQVGEKGIRSSLVVDDGFVYAASSDGVLHKLSVSADGALTEVGKVAFAAYSTSTPTISGGKAYVGGSLSNYKGVLAVIDLDTMTAVQVTKSDGAELPGEVKSAPLVSVNNGRTYAYFTCNGATSARSAYSSGGGVYAYCVGDVEASALYDPQGDLANYCMSSVIVGPDGTLYYTNDSGHLFALKAKSVGGDDPSGENPGNDGPGGIGNGGNGNGGSGSGEGSSGGSSDGDGAGSPAATAPLGAVAASHAPLTQEAADQAALPAPDKTKKAKASNKETRATGAVASDAGTSGEGRGGVNPWAAGGLALGVAGLVGAVAYEAVARRRKGGLS